ncbi:dihydroxyacetone kinase subunit DhaL [Intestinimonas massiliensis]|uniref:Dihydroxyacetone kinase subunit L n=1 Tax=Intestinimonas massiliensis (ex Afouda et al. 2020) TaxID=1673721 RepID=A0ABS9MEK6_9FIRM|nr:dihydroxyacetone kinase subunit DhaL [Intestinimonas massiliensis (ex Afouda et al. 2020)]MCG4529033.1 dihydroxyacetone kinase subunit L [Intestinimonas massiliensis (ex Afouda et al. 2020)]MCQ4808032.1 dihydroxyacetone kinase subunit DhaL [Intestinimonas massiliensis (ex Afouda et al. 2020)]
MLQLTPKQYVCYIKKVAKQIEEQKDYITELDAQTGDGDHWLNLNSGFMKLCQEANRLETMKFSDMFQEMAKIIMSVIGGSSGVLYGSAYMSSVPILNAVDVMDGPLIAKMLQAWSDAIMACGDTKPGCKTMVDCIYPAASAFNQALEENKTDAEALMILKQEAIKGADSTREMEAMRGRAYYQANKGVGHLDPGAVTMSIQLACFSDFLLENCMV